MLRGEESQDGKSLASKILCWEDDNAGFFFFTEGSAWCHFLLC